MDLSKLTDEDIRAFPSFKLADQMQILEKAFFLFEQGDVSPEPSKLGFLAKAFGQSAPDLKPLLSVEEYSDLTKKLAKILDVAICQSTSIKEFVARYLTLKALCAFPDTFINLSRESEPFEARYEIYKKLSLEVIEIAPKILSNLMKTSLSSEISRKFDISQETLKKIAQEPNPVAAIKEMQAHQESVRTAFGL